MSVVCCLRRAVAATVLLVLAACGGGGGAGGAVGADGSAAPTPRTPLATLSQDILPTGARLDLRERNYFPLNASDTWTYAYLPDGQASGQTATLSASAYGSGADIRVTESLPSGTNSSVYRRSAEGLLETQLFGEQAPPSLTRLVGDVLLYPEPFYAPGAERSSVRQGEWPADLDADGRNESFRFEFTQVLVGFETLTLPSGTLTDVAHFRNVSVLSLQGSDPRQPVVVVRGTEEVWHAPGIGLVRAERRIVDANGALRETPYTLVLASGNVAGAALFGPKADGAVRKLALVHKALVFDSARQVYYASVPGSVPVQGNRIATIDPASGSIRYAATAVGSEPSALAISADGSALYVGLDGSGELLKLRLPDMAVQWRVRLPQPSFYGQLLVERIAVSPLDADLVAVSMWRANVSPRHGGVALVRAGVLQPRMTQDHTGSNLIAFGGDGQFVYGFNNETTEFGLRRLAVLPDGLLEQQVTATSANFGSRTLDWSSNGLVLDRWVYRAPDLAQLGQVSVGGGGCRPHSVLNRLVCLNSGVFGGPAGVLAVVDAASFVVLATATFDPSVSGAAVSEIVPGPVGQVALRMNAIYVNTAADAVWLFTAPALR